MSGLDLVVHSDTLEHVKDPAKAIRETYRILKPRGFTCFTVPIVIAFSGNPERQGVITSLARPGGNLTGFSYMSSDLAAKRLALLCEAFAKCSRIAALYNPLEPATESELNETETGARSLGVTLHPIAVRSVDDLK